MKNDKPTSHETHVYDKLAKRNLDDVFPIHWKTTRPDDYDSGNDYGQDWLILLTDDNHKVTGAEFRVQSKTVDGEIENDVIKVSGVSVKTINYLLAIPLPVMFHVFHRSQKQGYWIWLHDWYTQNIPDLSKSDTVTISIPTPRILDENAVKEIIERVNDHQRRHSVIQLALSTSLNNDDFSIKTESSEVGIHFLFEPKHKNVSLNIFTDEEGNELIKHAEETGEQVTFSGQIDVNDAINEFSKTAFGEVVQFTYKHSFAKDIFLTIRFFDHNSNILIEFPFIRMKTLQAGTKLAVLQGSLDLITFKLTIDARNNKINFSPSADLAIDDVINLAKIIDTFEKIRMHRKIEIINLEKPQRPIYYINEEGVAFDFGITPLGIRLIKALAIIESQLNVSMEIPEHSDNQILEDIETIAEGLLQGYSNRLLCYRKTTIVISEMSDNPQDFFAKITDQSDNKAIIEVDAGENGFSLWGKKINLGQMYFEFSNLKMLNLAELIEKTRQSAVGVPTNYEILFEIDRNNVRTIFADWPKREKFESALSQVADVEPVEGDEL